MKRMLLLISLIGSAAISYSQNFTPVITNVTVLADTIFHKLTVRFDLADAENDTIEIFFAASSNSGAHFILNTADATGDVGFPVVPGSLKQIVWYYPDSLSRKIRDVKVKIVANDRNVLAIPQMLAQVDTHRMKQNLQLIEGIRHRITGASHLQTVRDSLFDRFQQSGLQTRIHEFSFDAAFNGENIIGRKRGIANEAATYIIDGHYDTVNDSPGADDNGSSIAGMLEILRIMSSLQLKNSVEFIAFDLEESGLSGSKAFVSYGMTQEASVQGVINMDMIGYYSDAPNSQTVPVGFDFAFPDLYAQLAANNFKGNFIISTANTNSKPLQLLFESLAAQYVPSLLVGSITVVGNGEVIPDSRRSDHVAFWDNGIKALHLSDGAETRNPNYHKPGDVSDSLNFSFMSDVIKTILAMLLNLTQPLHAGEAIAQAVVDPASGILEMQDGCRWKFAPNPATGMVKISLKNCGNDDMTMRLLALDGRIIFQTLIFPSRESKVDFSTIGYHGYCVLELTSKRGTLSKKILVQ